VKEVRLELSLPPSAPYVLVTTASLAEPPRAAFGAPSPG
jgi:hypothetical protein